MQVIEAIKNILADTLNLGDRKNLLKPESTLLGSIPELDSMGVINIIAGLEDYFGIAVNDDEISAKTFETLGSLVTFVDQKLVE